jgi:hypothetical protein
MISWQMLSFLGRFLRASPLAKEIEDWVQEDLYGPGYRLDGFDEQDFPRAITVEQDEGERSLYFDAANGTARMTHFIDLLEEAREPARVPVERNQLAMLFKQNRHFMSSDSYKTRFIRSSNWGNAHFIIRRGPEILDVVSCKCDTKTTLHRSTLKRPGI